MAKTDIPLIWMDHVAIWLWRHGPGYLVSLIKFLFSMIGKVFQGLFALLGMAGKAVQFILNFGYKVIAGILNGIFIGSFNVLKLFFASRQKSKERHATVIEEVQRGWGMIQTGKELEGRSHLEKTAVLYGESEVARAMETIRSWNNESLE